MWIGAALIFAAALLSALDWRFAARLMPQTAATAGLLVVAVSGASALVGWLRDWPIVPARGLHDSAGALHGLRDGEIYARFARQLLWLLGLLLAVFLIGMLPAIALFTALHMRVEGRTPFAQALILTAALVSGMFLLFVKLLHVPWPPSLLGDLFPTLREAAGRLI